MNLVVTLVNSSSENILSCSSNLFLIQLINKSTLSFFFAEIGIISSKSYNSFNLVISSNSLVLSFTKSILFNNKNTGTSLSFNLFKINSSPLPNPLDISTKNNIISTPSVLL